MKLLALIAVLAPIAARADDLTPKAREFAERGRELHAAGNYAAAIDAFKEAYVIAPAPALLFNLAQAYRLEGNCNDASLMYRRYLASDPPPEGRAIAEAQLVNVEQCVRERPPIAPSPGGTGIAIAPVADEPMPQHARLERNIGLGFAIAGGLALGGAVYYGVAAARDASTVSDAYAMGAAGKDIAPIDERGRHRALDAKLLAGGGTLAVIGGVALYLVGHRAASVSIMPSSDGGRVSMSWVW